MTNKQKLLGGGLLAGLLYWWTSQNQDQGPRITVLQIIPGSGPGETFAYWPMGISFTMSVNGHTMSDTIYAGDQDQAIEAGDGVHQFLSQWSEVNDDSGALLSIRARKSNGTYDTLASGYLSAYYPSNALPTSLS